MKINLDKIENNLQLLFESSIRLLSGVDFSRMVIHNLVRAMEGSMFTRPDGLLTASHIYTIRVHPDMLDAWQSKQDVLDQLSNELIKSAGDAGVVFLYAPVIRLAADEHQNQDQITITPSLSEKAVGETSAVILRNGTELPQEKHHKKEQLIQAILDAAEELILEQGYANLSMRKIARKIDYSATAIYKYFSNKSEIVYHIMQNIFSQMVGEYRAVLSENIPDPVKRLKKLLKISIKLSILISWQ